MHLLIIKCILDSVRARLAKTSCCIQQSEEAKAMCDALIKHGLPANQSVRRIHSYFKIYK